MLTDPTPVPAGAVLYKYASTSTSTSPVQSSPVQPVYSPVDALVSGSTLTYTSEDGGVGDDDLTVNGQIVDPVGLGGLLRCWLASTRCRPAASGVCCS